MAYFKNTTQRAVKGTPSPSPKAIARNPNMKASGMKPAPLTKPCASCGKKR